MDAIDARNENASSSNFMNVTPVSAYPGSIDSSQKPYVYGGNGAIIDRQRISQPNDYEVHDYFHFLVCTKQLHRFKNPNFSFSKQPISKSNPLQFMGEGIEISAFNSLPNTILDLS
jgi:hypothetical protein